MRRKDDEKGKNSFVFYHEWAEHVADEPDEVRLEFFDAIVSYSITGEIPALGTSLRIAFKFIKAQMDRDKAKYENISKKRSEAGKNGMKKRWNESGKGITPITNDNKNNNVINGITKITNITDNVNVDVDDNVDVNVDVDSVCEYARARAKHVITPITNDNKNNNVINGITKITNITDNVDVDVDDNVDVDVDDDVTTRINTSVCEYKRARTRAKLGWDENLREIIARQQQEEKKARQFQLTLYQNDAEQLASFPRPTEEQVFERMCTCTNGSLANARDEARKFVNHYKANGWLVGRNPMRDLDAAIENWIDNIKNYGNRQQQANEESRRNFVAAIRNVEERARYEEEHGKEELPF